MNGDGGLIGPDPGYTMQATNCRVSNLVKCTWRKVEISDGTGHTSVSDCNGYRFPLVCSLDFSTADWVVVGIAPSITGIVIEQLLGDGNNEVRILINDTTCAKTGAIECTISGIGTGKPGRTIGGWGPRWGRSFLRGGWRSSLGGLGWSRIVVNGGTWGSGNVWIRANIADNSWG